MEKSDPVHPPVLHGPRRLLYVGLGCFFVVLAALGVALPVLPTTPFLLLASYFFIRSSPALNRWLLRSPLFGPLLRDWQRHRGVRLHVKVSAVTLLVLVGSASVVWGNLPWPLLALLIGLLLVGLVVVLRLPLVRDRHPADRGEAAVCAPPADAGATDGLCPPGEVRLGR